MESVIIDGSFQIEPPLSSNHKKYLERFSETKRLYRNSNGENYPDYLRVAVGLPYGPGGAFYAPSRDPGGS